MSEEGTLTRIDALLGALEQKRMGFASRLAGCEAGLTTIENAFASQAAFLKPIETAASQLREPLAVLERAGQVSERLAELLDQLAAQIDRYEEALTSTLAALQDAVTDRTATLGEWRETLIEQREAAHEAFSEMVDDMIPDVAKELSDAAAELTERVTEAVDQAEQLTEDLSERSEELRESAETVITDLFSEAIPQGVADTLQTVDVALAQLDEAGLNEFSRIKESIGTVQENTRSITDLVEKAKPVLSLAERVM